MKSSSGNREGSRSGAGTGTNTSTRAGIHQAIEVTGLRKAFGNLEVIRGIDFTVPQGSVFGFLGPNGAGKTTTIKILLGLLRACEGRAAVLGEPVIFGDKLNFLQRTGYLPQDPVFPEGLTGKEVLEMVSEIYGMEQRQEQNQTVNRFLEEFELSGAARRRVETYSRGMKQRLGLATVLLPRPELMILDEPVSALDPGGRKNILELIQRLKGNATVFFSSHILADVERVCDRLAIIDRGVKLIEAPTAELLEQHAVEKYTVTVPPEQIRQTEKILKGPQTPGDLLEKIETGEEEIILTSRPGKSSEIHRVILPLLIQRRIEVIEFKRHRVDLEEAFFNILEQGRQDINETRWES